MNVGILSHRSSIEYLDTHQVAPSEERGVGGSVLELFDVPGKRGYCGRDFHMDERLVRLGIPLPAHCLTRRAGAKPGRCIIPHICRGALSTCNLVETVVADVLACRPELALSQMVPHTSKGLATAAAIELAGTFRTLRPEAAAWYAAIPGTTIEYYPRGSDAATCDHATAYGLKPLVSTVSVERFCSDNRGAYGSGRLRWAGAHMVDGLASPLETHFHLLGFLPRGDGGLALPSARVNERLVLPPAAVAFTGKRTIVPDFFWPEQRVAVEVDGDLYHGHPDGIVQTSLRMKAYRTMGIAAFTVTAAEVYDPTLFELSVREVYRALGARFRKLDDTFRVRALLLREELGIARVFTGEYARVRDAMAAQEGYPDAPASPFEDEGWFACLESYIDGMR